MPGPFALWRTHRQTPPPAVTAGLPPGGISLRWQTVTLAGETVYLHHFVVPKGRNQDETAVDPGLKNKPVTREEITPGPILEPSPFTVELYRAAGGDYKRLHRATYYDEGDVSEITVKYLIPAKRQGPILLLNGGFTHWRSWTLIILPDGVNGKRAVAQRFLWGSEGGTGVLQQFDRTDKNGYLQVNEEAFDEGKPPVYTIYRWDGYRFTDPKARWFVLGAVSKKRAEVEEFVQKHRLHDFEIIETARFPKLAPGLFAVVLSRCTSSREALEEVALWKRIGVPCYQKQAL